MTDTAEVPVIQETALMHAMQVVQNAALLSSVYPRGAITFEVDYTSMPIRCVTTWTDEPTGKTVVARLRDGGLSTRWDPETQN